MGPGLGGIVLLNYTIDKKVDYWNASMKQMSCGNQCARMVTDE